MKLPFPVLTSNKIVVTQYVTDHELILDLRISFFQKIWEWTSPFFRKLFLKMQAVLENCETYVSQ